MILKKKYLKARERRHLRIRGKVEGTKEQPRVSVRRSLKNLFVQFIDDAAHHTLLSVSTLDPDFTSKLKYGGNVKAATLLGELAAGKAKEKNIVKVVFDRGGYLYHGRIKALAEALRKGGLHF